MKAITLWQPWASLIAEGVKTIETRSWPAPPALVGERIAIHAAAKRPSTLWHHHADEDVPPWIDLIAMARHWEWTENVADYTAGGAYRWTGPLGSVVATARLAACVPMVDLGDWFEGPCLWIWEGSGSHPTTLAYDRNGWKASDSTEMSDQLPYGDFAPGRWAWLLDDVERLDEPIPAKGRQKVWEWTG